MPFYFIVFFTTSFAIIRTLDKYFSKDYQAISCTEYDRIAVDLSILVLHAYAQLSQGQPLDFSKEVKEKKIFTHLPKPPSLIENWIFYPFQGQTGIAYKNLSFLKSDSILGFIACNHKEKVIAITFRNSRTLSDWVSNFTPGFNKNILFLYEGYLHNSYTNIFNNSIGKINNLFEKIVAKIPDPTNYHLLLTGHSLGGALATLMAVYAITNPLYQRYFHAKSRYLITFGAPYVGVKNKCYDFSKWIKEHIKYIKCFERTTDIIPQVAYSIHRQWEKRFFYKKNNTWMKPIAPNKPIDLFHFYKSRFEILRAHSIVYYRLAIYQSLKLTCPPLYKKF